METHSNILAWRILWTEEPGEFIGRKGWTQLKQLSAHKSKACYESKVLVKDKIYT